MVTVDHTHEAAAVEFPDGRVITGRLTEMNAETVWKMLEVRVADVRYVLDQLTAIQAGEHHDAINLRLPEGLINALDLSKVGILRAFRRGSNCRTSDVRGRSICRRHQYGRIAWVSAGSSAARGTRRIASPVHAAECRLHTSKGSIRILRQLTAACFGSIPTVGSSISACRTGRISASSTINISCQH